MANPLVAYFSATGTTARVAEHLAVAAQADLYEIAPETPYSAADLDWHNSQSRSSLEMNDPASRPALADYDAPVEAHDTIFVGFPIWWYTAPRIIDSFLDAYDFSGKTIALFATSGSSGLGNTADDLRAAHPGITIVDGKLLNGNPSIDTLQSWAISI